MTYANLFTIKRDDAEWRRRKIARQPMPEDGEDGGVWVNGQGWKRGIKWLSD